MSVALSFFNVNISQVSGKIIDIGQEIVDLLNFGNRHEDTRKGNMNLNFRVVAPG